ncbi:MAG: tetratricopeptide repeat protein [Polyangiaceae bacterium]
MAIDRDKVQQNAQKLVEKKKYDKAVLEYQKIVQEDPNDARTLLKIGDLQHKMGAYADAIATYERVGKFYSQQGFALKAIAVFKQIREIIAKHVPQLEDRYGHIAPKLADLYQSLGLTTDALAALDDHATALQRAQKDSEALGVFQKIVELDPTNPLPHLRLAEALSRAKDSDGAVQEFGIAAAQLVKLNRRDDAIKVFERLLHHKPDPTHARLAAELYLARGQQADGMQALSKLQTCFQANPKDLDTLALLARAFNVIGQGAKAIEVQKEMARIARDQGRLDVFQDLVQKLQRAAPHDEVVRQLAAQLAAPPEPKPAAAKPPPPRGPQPIESLPPDAIDDEELELVDAETSEVEAEELLEEPDGAEPFPLQASARAQTPQGLGAQAARHPQIPAAPRAPAPMPAPAPVPQPAPVHDARVEIARCLADATSFRRARLYPRAIDALRGGLESHPESIELREALRDIYIESGRDAEALDEMLAIATIYANAGEVEASVRTLEDVLASDPTNAQAIDILRQLGYEVYEEQPPGEELPSLDDPQYAAKKSVRPSAPAGEPPLPSYDLDDAPRAGSELGNIDDPFGADAPLPAYALDGEPAEEPPSQTSFDLVDRKPAPPPASVRGPAVADLEEALEEAEFFLSRGLYDDARAIVHEQLARAPNHPLLLERLTEIDSLEAAASETGEGTGTTKRRSMRPEDPDFDIDAQLGAIDGLEVMAPEAPIREADAQVDVEEVFAKFKEGVAKQISVDDGQSHYDLGLAYKEMGLLDDAIHEFNVASRDVKRTCICQSMIGMIQNERGNYTEAIAAFLAGLDADIKTPDQELALWFEVGAGYESKKQTKDAIQYFRKVKERDPSYRDVEERLRRLEKPDAKPREVKVVAVADDEFDKAFDDILGGVLSVRVVSEPPTGEGSDTTRTRDALVSWEWAVLGARLRPARSSMREVASDATALQPARRSSPRRARARTRRELAGRGRFLGSSRSRPGPCSDVRRRAARRARAMRAAPMRR